MKTLKLLVAIIAVVVVGAILLTATTFPLSAKQIKADKCGEQMVFNVQNSGYMVQQFNIQDDRIQFLMPIPYPTTNYDIIGYGYYATVLDVNDNYNKLFEIQYRDGDTNATIMPSLMRIDNNEVIIISNKPDYYEMPSWGEYAYVKSKFMTQKYTLEPIPTITYSFIHRV
ncbi:MAG: hypothetical protein LBO69_05310 [Ignavibacteria bacterium]|jgi:hypothetical protein|nr:hypothetical protein [Ignavibacteria bacterium]